MLFHPTLVSSKGIEESSTPSPVTIFCCTLYTNRLQKFSQIKVYQLNQYVVYRYGKFINLTSGTSMEHPPVDYYKHQATLFNYLDCFQE